MKSKHLLLMLFLALLAPWAAKAQSVQYPTWSSGTSSYIKEFKVMCGTTTLLDNVTTGTAAQATDYYDDGSLVINAQAGDELTCTISTYNSGTHGFGLWADLDGDGLDETDLIDGTTGYQSTPRTITFTIPSNTPAGEYRLRIVAAYYTGTCSNPNGSYSNGESEDYKLVVTVPSCPKPINLAATLTPGDGTVATLNWNPGGTETSWKYQISTYSDFSDSPRAKTVKTNTVNLTGLTAEQTYYARVKAACSTSDESEWTVCQFTPTNALTITINDVTNTTNQYVPIYGYYADNTQRSEFIIPAADLASISGTSLESMKFYANYDFTSTGTFQVYLKEVAEETFSSATFYTANEATTVYTGTVTVSSTDGMTITFDDSFDYNGGNLLVGFYLATSGGNYSPSSSDKFEGVTATGASLSMYSSNGTTQRNFLPKVTISYSLNAFPKPKNLTVSNLTNDGATITWLAPTSGTPTGYKYQYMPEGGSWTALTSTTDLSAPLTGLIGNTNYTFQVQAIYAGGESGFATKTFTTDCDAYTIPYAYGFETAQDMACWTIVDNYGSAGAVDNAWSQSQFGDDLSRTGDNFFFFYYVDYDDTDPDYMTLVSPQLSIPATANGLHVEFYYRTSGSYLETFRVGYSTTDNALSSFTWGGEISSESPDYQRFVANYPVGTKYVAIQYTSDNMYFVCIDDITFDEAASCLEPTNVLVDNITTTGATVSWTPGAAETAWDIYVTNDNSVAPVEATTPTYAGVTSNVNQPISGLTSGTTYYVYVRSACDATTVSDWAMPIQFNTECEGMTLPYSYDFEDDALPVCWSIINANTSWNHVNIVSVSTNKVLGLYRGTSGSETLVAVLPEVDANYQLNEYQITFDAAYANSSSTSIIVGIMTNPEDFTTFEPVEEIEITNDYTTFESHKVRFNNYTGSGKYIAIRNNSTQTGYVLVDNLAVSHLPACLEPENLTVDNNSITGHEVTLNWDGTSPNYQIEYWTKAGNNGSMLNENFDNLTAAGSIPAGWNNDEGTTTSTNYKWCHNDRTSGNGNPNGTSHDGSNCVVFNSYMNGNGNTNFLMTPAMNFPAGNAMQLSFWWKNPTAGDFSVEISTDGGATKTPLLENLTGQSTWKQETVDLAAYIGASNVTIHFKGTSNYGNGDAYIYLDDVVIGEVVPAGPVETATTTTPNETTVTLQGLDPETVYEAWVYGDCGTDGLSPEHSNMVTFKTGVACLPPTNLTNADPAKRSVVLNWVENGTATAWEVCINGDETNLVNAYTNTNFLLEDLEPDTYYTVKVRANCGSADGVSTYSNSVNFTTLVACPTPTNLAVPTAGIHTTYAELTWTENGDAEAWQICKDNDMTNLINVAAADVTIDGSTIKYTLNGLEASEHYTVKVRANCGSTDGYSTAWSNEVEFDAAAECPVPVIEGVSEVTAHTAKVTWNDQPENINYVVSYRTAEKSPVLLSEDFNGLTTANTIPDGWNNSEGTTTSASSKWSYNTNTSGSGATSGTSHDGSNCVRFDSYNNSSLKTNYLVTPAVDNPIQLTFWWKNPAGGDFSVYISTDGGATETPLLEGLTGQSSWTQETVDLSAYVDASNVTIHFKGTSNYGYGDAYIYLDDVVVMGENIPAGAWQTREVTKATEGTSVVLENLEANTSYDVKVKGICESGENEDENLMQTFTTTLACPAPTALDHGTITTNSVVLTWTKGGSETAWQISVNDVISDISANVTATANPNEVSYTLDELTVGTAYTVKVRANCGITDGVSTDWTNEISFNTKCNAIVDFPWREDFENYSATTSYGTSGTSFSDPCWVNERIADGTGSGNLLDFQVSTYSQDGNASVKLHLPDMKNGSKTKLVLPEMTLPNSDFVFSMDIYRASGSYANEGIRVFVSTDGELTDATELAFIPRCYGYSNSVIPTESAAGWYTYDLPLGISGTCYIILQGESQYGSGTWMDNFVVQEAISYTKPVTAYSWYAIASPVKNPNVADVNNLVEGDYDLYRYSEVNGTWQNYKAHNGVGTATDATFTTLETGRGYIYRRAADETLVFTGVPNTKSSFSLNYYGTGNLKGFNLVGNPFGGYATVGMECYKLNTDGTWEVQTGYQAEAMEGVLVHATATSQSVAFTAVTNTKSAPTATPAQTLAFTVNGNGYKDVTYALLEEGDNLPKIGHLAADAPMLSIAANGSSYAIARLGYNVEAFDMSFSGNGSYTLTAELGTLPYCHLIDRVAGKDIDLLSAKSYTFSASSNDANRFVVVLTPNGEEDILGNFVYWNGNGWTIDGNGTLEVYDVLGRPLFSKEVADQSTLSTQQFPAAGVYMLRMGDKSQKIVVK